jgi:hypothetical protein
MSNDVTLSGPLFDGRAEAALHRYMDVMPDDVAQKGIDLIHIKLPTVLRHDTGRYEAHVHKEKQLDDLVITDTPVVYGPWLEGTGSRNSPKTRFRGYGTFKLMKQALDAEAGDIAQHSLDVNGTIKEMNA